ncbi:hypothetical protein HPB52_008236 [Rhipicephalus sanguineus]|uniref:FP protein C-terminal domain-containing protein n=1 Tax=Rhipicephalus sanguineus TaxID=34632 RepID=A0A9D4SS85_RHISA|nr:hypothetical protein HPB52_008236 [Rhipicephalus sanguineus]
MRCARGGVRMGRGRVKRGSASGEWERGSGEGECQITVPRPGQGGLNLLGPGKDLSILRPHIVSWYKVRHKRVRPVETFVGVVCKCGAARGSEEARKRSAGQPVPRGNKDDIRMSCLRLPGDLVRFLQRSRLFLLRRLPHLHGLRWARFAASCRNHMRNASTNQDKPIFVNDHLTPENKRLFAQALALKKEKQWQFLWVDNCRIKARKTTDNRVYRISGVGDLAVFS